MESSDEKEYCYKYLVEGVDFLEGPSYNYNYDEVDTEFRVGPNPNAPENEFCIEDSIGRFIPFRWESLGELMVLLDNLELQRLDKSKKENSNGNVEDL